MTKPERNPKPEVRKRCGQVICAFTGLLFRPSVFGINSSFGIRHSSFRVRLLGLLIFTTIGCRREMYDQPSSRPLERSQFFDNQMASRPLPAYTIARGHLR